MHDPLAKCAVNVAEFPAPGANKPRLPHWPALVIALMLGFTAAWIGFLVWLIVTTAGAVLA
jgi:hypothetical protein